MLKFENATNKHRKTKPPVLDALAQNWLKSYKLHSRTDQPTTQIPSLPGSAVHASQSLGHQAGVDRFRPKASNHRRLATHHNKLTSHTHMLPKEINMTPELAKHSRLNQKLTNPNPILGRPPDKRTARESDPGPKSDLPSIRMQKRQANKQTPEPEN